MTAKPLVRRARARSDAEGIVDYYRSVSNNAIARDFIARLEQALRAIRLHPAAGSLRYGYDLNLPGLRSWQVKRYPYLVFYFDTPSNIDIWRILHAQRDIASSLHEPDGAETQ